MTVIATVATSVAAGWIWALNWGLLGQLYCWVRESRSVDRLWRGFAWLHQELWLFAFPGILINAGDDLRSGSPWGVVVDAVLLYIWWAYRNWPDENRWKRRGRKLKDAVAERAGRLVVVPAVADA